MGDDIREFADVKRQFSPMHKSPIKSSPASKKSFFFKCGNGFPWRATNLKRTAISHDFPESSDLFSGDNNGAVSVKTPGKPFSNQILFF